MQLNQGLSVWQNPKDFFLQILSFLWKGHNKRLQGQTVKGSVNPATISKPEFCIFFHYSKHEYVSYHYQHKKFTVGKLFLYNLVN